MTTPEQKKRYKLSPKGRAALKRENISPAGKARHKRYDQSEKGRRSLRTRAKRWFLKRMYGLTEDTVKTMKQKQDYCCAICKKRLRLEIDHNHSTGIVRGLLCRCCNMGIGAFHESRHSLKSAIVYLEKAK